jgi:4-diphosphocytidyl-2-C-methyl-D-erythritol kinase
MPTAIRSFAKINLGLKIGPPRPDGFHELRTIYQTIALHDVIKFDAQPGSGIEIHCADPRVPTDNSNTCYRVAERVLQKLGRRDKVVIAIEKHLPVQGGLGAASSNAVATIFALERELGVELSFQDRFRIAADVGSDLNLFLIGGTVLGVDRGQEVYPLPDLPPLDLVVLTPAIGVSTPKAFADWDALVSIEQTASAIEAAGYGMAGDALTRPPATGTIRQFGEAVYAWLSKGFPSQAKPASGVPAVGGDRAETPLLDLVRAGIENDFERVVFPVYPELREAKRVLVGEGAHYASLSGSGSTLYGVFPSAEVAKAAARRISAAGYAAVATRSLTREEYWKSVASG